MMGSKSRKRSRSIVEENRAECPFTVSMTVAPRQDRDRPKTKKQKRDGQPEEEKKAQLQNSPFAPTGKFKTNETMDCYYSVEPRKRWTDMTRYNSFVLNGNKYWSEGFVYVANEATIERQKAGNPHTMDPIRKSDDDWVARILEIRAADEHHVYARVYWMYSPDELPANTLDGKRFVQGRQPYHGKNELIASNHMDIINVVSVTMPAVVNQWIETDDDDIQSALYWRQAFDCRTSELSSVEVTCKCGTPANPDIMLIGCTNADCGKWLHRQCLVDDILAKVYDHLGTDKPHVSEPPAVKEEKEDENMNGPLSPTESKAEETQPTIDVRGGETTNNVLVKQADGETPKPTETPTPVPQPAVGATSTKPVSEKKNRRKSTNKPWQGLFNATLKMNEGPTHWVIEDLRTNVSGGDSTWTEKAECLICGVAID